MPLFPSGKQTSINDAVLCLFLRFKGPQQSNQIHLLYERGFPEDWCESTGGKMCLLNRLSSFWTYLSCSPELNALLKVQRTVHLCRTPRTAQRGLSKTTHDTGKIPFHLRPRPRPRTCSPVKEEERDRERMRLRHTWAMEHFLNKHLVMKPSLVYTPPLGEALLP